MSIFQTKSTLSYVGILLLFRGGGSGFGCLSRLDFDDSELLKFHSWAI